MKMIFFNEHDSGPSFDPHSIDRDELPLHQAVSYGSPDAVKRLLRTKTKGLELEARDRYGYTPLHLAVWSQRLEVVDLLLKHPRTSVNCKDQDGNTPLWLSTYMSCDEITERLLDERSIDINFIGGRGRYQTPSTSLHHAAARLDTVILRRLLAVPGIDLNLCAAGQSPFSVAVAHGNVKTMTMLLNVGGVEINGRGLADPPICRAAEKGHREAVKLLVQQGERLNINFGTRAAQNTALCIAARDGDAEMVRDLLRHDQIDPNLKNRWFQAPFSLAAKGEHLVVIDALLTDRRLTLCSLMTSLSWAKNDCIRRAIQSKIDDFNTRHGQNPAGSPGRRVAAFSRSQQ
jgi:ankyrin repeat protein